MLLLSTIAPILALARQATAAPGDSFTESLTLHPLPDGKLSVSFEFTTHFTSASLPLSSGHSHHSLTPPSLLLPLVHNNVSELTISFVAGQWDQRRSGEAGPLQYEAGGGGGEVRGWLKGNQDKEASSEAWTRVTHALGGLFCAGLGPNEHATGVNTFGDIYPPARGDPSNLTHHLLPHSNLLLCTENLTPFLSLLPSKGLSGLSSLLAQPNVVFAWGFKTEGIEVIMPTDDAPGQWRGWWEGIADLTPRPGGNRDFSIEKLFKRGLPKAFPEADESVLKLILPQDRSIEVNHEPSRTDHRWIDGKLRDVREWDLLSSDLSGKNLDFHWNDEHHFVFPRTFTPPPVSVSRTVTERHAGDGVLTVQIENTGEEDRSGVYSEVWPWWVKGWLHEITIEQQGQGPRPDLVESMFYDPSTPPTPSSTTLHLTLSIPARSVLVLRIPFSKLQLKYTDYRPDAERGVEIPSGTLTLLDLQGEDGPADGSQVAPKRSSRTRIYTSRLLLDIPTPDFSMPYNVIIMTCTVMAVFFGLMQGSLTRKWGWVRVQRAGDGASERISEKVEDPLVPVAKQ